MEQNSRLSIAVDISKAKNQVMNISADLRNLETIGISVTKSLAKLGANVNLSGLNTSVANTRNNLNSFATTATSTALAIDRLSAASLALRTSTQGIGTNLSAAAGSMTNIKNISNSLNTASTSANTFNNSTKGLNTSLIALNTTLVTGKSNLSAYSQAAVTAGQRTDIFGRAATQSQTRLRGLDTGLISARTNMQQMATATSSLNAFFGNLNAQMGRLATVTNNLNNATIRANAAYNQLGGGIGAANRQAQAFTFTLTSLRGVMASITSLQGVLMGSLAGIAGLNFLKTADEMQNLNSQIKLVTKSEEEALGIKQKVREIADKNFNDIKATTNLYQNSARALSNLGKSQQQTLIFTDAVSLAMRTGGKSAGEQASAILQLGQAMGSGVLMGDEFRSIAENAPILLELVSKRMGVLPGQLKGLASDGKITADIIYDAFSQNINLLEDMAKKMPLTMGQAFTLAKNQYKYFIDGVMNDTGGMSSVIADMIVGVGTNFEALANILGGAIVVGLASYVTGVVGASIATSGLSAASLGLTGSLFAYTTSVTIATGAINIFLRAVALTNSAIGIYSSVATVASAVTRNGLAFALIAAATAFTSAAISIENGVRALGRWSTYANIASGSAARLGGSIAVVTGAFVRLAGVINAHPLMVLAAVLIGIVASTEDANGEMLGLTGAIDSLGDAVGIVGYMLGDFINFTMDGFTSLSSVVGLFINDLINGSEHGTAESGASFDIFFQDTEKGFVGILHGATRMVAAATSTLAGFFQWMGNGWWQIGRVAANAFIWLSNTAKSIISSLGSSINDLINIALSGVNWLAGGANDLLSKTPITWRFKMVGDVEWRDPKYTQTPYYAIEGKTLGGNIQSNIDTLMPMVDSYFTDSKARRDKKKSDSESFSPSTGAMDDIKAAQYEAFLAQQALDDAKEAEKKLGKAAKKTSKTSKEVLAVNAKVLKHAADYDYAAIEAQYPSLPKGILAAVEMQESRGNATARGPQTRYGVAKGAFQFLDGTARDMGVANSDNVEQAAKGAAKYLDQLIRQFASVDVGIAAYNAGPGNTAKHGGYKGKIPPFKETKNYVKEVNARLNFMSGGIDGSVDVSGSIAAAQKRLDDANKKLKEFYKEQADIEKEYESTPEKIKREFVERLERIQAGGFDDVKAGNLANKAKAIAAREQAAYENSLTEKLDALSAFKQSEEEILTRQYEKAKFDIEIDPEFNLEGNEVLLQQALDSIDEQYSYSMAKNQLANEKMISELYAFKKTEREILNDSWNEKIAEAGLATDAIRDIRLEAYNEQQAYELKLFDANEAIKQLDIKQAHLTEIEYIKQKYALERDLINLSPVSAEQKQGLLIQAGAPLNEKMKEVRNKFNPEISASEAIRKEYEANLAVVDAYESQYTDLITAHTADRLAVEQSYTDAKRDLILTQGGAMFGSLAEMGKTFLGEQSRMYKALFLVEKVFAVASGLLAIKTSIAKATAMGVTPIDKAFYISEAVITGTSVLADIHSVAMKGFKDGGYTGNMGVNEIAGPVHGQEYVLNAQATKKIGVNNLDAMNRGGSIGGDTIVNLKIENYTNAPVKQTMDDDGRIRVIVGEEIDKQIPMQINDPNSPTFKALTNNFILPRNL